MPCSRSFPSSCARSSRSSSSSGPSSGLRSRRSSRAPSRDGLARLRAALLVVCVLLAAGVVGPAGAEVRLGFDDAADGTVIDSYYALLGPGFTFANPIGGSVYARTSLFNVTPDNVVSVVPAGIPAFNATLGAVDVTFGSGAGAPVREVAVQVAAVASLEPLGTPQNRPFMQVWDGYNQLRATVYFQGALPTNSLEVTPFETLRWALPACIPPCIAEAISRIRLSAQQTQPGPPIYALFDELVVNPDSCSNLLVINGEGSGPECDGTLVGQACTVWTCPTGYTAGADPVCQPGGTWSGPAICTADACYGEPMIPFGSSSGCAGLPNGSTCTTWSCDPGYEPLGSDPLCVDGGWSGDFGCYAVWGSVPVLPGGGAMVLAASLLATATGWLVRRR